MTDLFAEFGLAPHPAPDEKLLDDRYRARAADCHPDHAHGDAEGFARLTEAWQVLRTPSRRLHHLAALQAAPKGTAMPTEVFQIVADALASASIASRPATTPLSRAVRDHAVVNAVTQLRSARARIATDTAAVLSELAARWPAVSGRELSDAAATLAYGERWDAQLAEAEHALTAG